MDHLLQQGSDDENQLETNEQIQQRLLEEMARITNFDQQSQCDDQSQLNESMMMKDLDQFDSDFNQSQAWQEFQKGNQQRDNYLMEAEHRVQQMRAILQTGEQELELDDDYDFGKKVKVKITPAQFKPEQLEQIKMKVKEQVKEQQEQIAEPEKPPQKAPSQETNRFALRQNDGVRKQKEQEEKMRTTKERMERDRESSQMEIEDQRSLELEQQEHQALFRQRMYQLPSLFPEFKQSAHHTPKFVFDIGQVPTQTIRILPVPTLEEGNLAPHNSLEIVKYTLSKMVVSMALPTKTSKPTKSNKLQPLQAPQQSKALVFGSESPTKHFQSERELIYHRIYEKHLETMKTQQMLKLSNDSTISAITKIKEKYVPYNLPYSNFEENITQMFLFQSLLMEQQNPAAQNSLEQYLTTTMMNPSTTKLEIKLEGINTLEGINRFKSLRQLLLSSNRLTTVHNQIGSCNGLIEVNLSQNSIIEYSEIGKLPNLRILILEMNKIQAIPYLKCCQYLELYNLSGNDIQVMENLHNLHYLKRLTLFKNRIVSVGALGSQAYLEELDLGSNQICKLYKIQYTHKSDSENPFQPCFNLRQLYLCNNNLTYLPKRFSQTFLKELWIQQNGLISLEGLTYLPSLDSLLAQDNQLTHCIGIKSEAPYMLNLKTLNLGRNKLTSFGSIKSLLRHARSLTDIDFSDNPFTLTASQVLKLFLIKNVLQLQSLILMKISPKLCTINRDPVGRHDIEFLSQKFSRIIEEPEQQPPCRNESHLLNFCQQIQSYNTLFNRLASLSQRKLQKTHDFAYTKLYKELYVLEDMNFYACIEKGIPYKDRITPSIEQFELWQKRSLLKVKSFLIRWIYLVRKRNKYYAKHTADIIRAQAFVRGRNVRKVIQLDNILASRRFNAKAKYAIKIQRQFRLHLFRIRKRIALQGAKFIDKDIDEMEDFDDAFFNQPLDMAYGLKIPEGMDIAKLFAQQTQQQQTQQQQQVQKNNFFKYQKSIYNSSSEASPTPKMPNIKQTSMNQQHQASEIQKEELRNSKYSSKSEQLPSVSKKVTRYHYVSQQQSEQKIMDEWGFSNPQVAQVFAMRMEKNLKRKAQSNKKTLTAEQRLQQNFYRKT